MVRASFMYIMIPKMMKIFVVAHKPFEVPEGKVLADYEAMQHGELAQKVKEDRVEKFENPAILLGLKNDGIL